MRIPANQAMDIIRSQPAATFYVAVQYRCIRTETNQAWKPTMLEIPRKAAMILIEEMRPDSPLVELSIDHYPGSKTLVFIG